jgi:hypothetical protein
VAVVEKRKKKKAFSGMPVILPMKIKTRHTTTENDKRERNGKKQKWKQNETALGKVREEEKKYTQQGEIFREKLVGDMY